MITMEPVVINGTMFTAVSVQLPKTNFMAVANDKGYIACGALDVALLNERLGSRRIIAGRAVSVRTIQELLEAPLESVTKEAETLGIVPGMKGTDALAKMAAAP
ncbi:DUF1805 domain-containing protein [Metabacillus sp. GX 13764]|uniref:YunC family protein n=1 Tax=Metabacillus kandeliae TaxID=2900151 RepID=UPI001E2E210B|nr:DUF1805 domain-containing protein [Metabacillus kandeliae]MCD7036268.1 DUF1805 domain-containing protein [Metabacillus kandeliae]